MMFVGYIKGISREMDEAAGMDGAGYIRYLFQIILPLMKFNCNRRYSNGNQHLE